MNSPDPLSENRFKTAGDCPDFAQSAEQNETVPFAEAGFETISKLLHAADDAAPRPPLAPDLAAAVHRRTRQRVSRRNRLAAASALVAVVAVISLLHFYTLSPSGRGQGEGDAAKNSMLASSQPPVAGLLPPDLARLKSEAAALKSQADDLDRQLHVARNEQTRQDLRDEYRRQVVQVANDDVTPSAIDRAALTAIGQGDFYWETHQDRDEVQAAYQSVVQNFPGSPWAQVARDRLEKFRMN